MGSYRTGIKAFKHLNKQCHQSISSQKLFRKSAINYVMCCEYEENEQKIKATGFKMFQKYIL